jgi:hypothetical protein
VEEVSEKDVKKLPPTDGCAPLAGLLLLIIFVLYTFSEVLCDLLAGCVVRTSNYCNGFVAGSIYIVFGYICCIKLKRFAIWVAYLMYKAH